MKKLIGVGLAALTSLLVLTGCNNSILATEKTDEEIIIKKDKARELEVVVNFGAGKMEVTGGANEWVNGNAVYEPEKMKPEVVYDRVGNTGKVEISQPNNLKIGKQKNEWYLQVNEEVPVDLVINAGASKTDLNLNGIQLKGLEVNAGVGEVNVDLGGDWKNSFSGQISSGIGKMTVILPEETGVRIKASKGIGSANFEGFISRGDGIYENEAFENAKVKIDLKVDLGIGEVTFKTEK